MKYKALINLYDFNIDNWAEWNMIDYWCQDNIGNIGIDWKILICATESNKLNVEYLFNTNENLSLFILTWK